MPMPSVVCTQYIALNESDWKSFMILLHGVVSRYILISIFFFIDANLIDFKYF